MRYIHIHSAETVNKIVCYIIYSLMKIEVCLYRLHKVSLPQQHGLHFDRKIVNVRIKVNEAVELWLGHAQEVEQDEVLDPVDHVGGGRLAPPRPGVGVVGGGPGGGQVPRPVQRVRRGPIDKRLLTYRRQNRAL